MSVKVAGLLLAAAVAAGVWPGYRVILGLSPEEVLLVHVREENSLGLTTAVPSPEEPQPALDERQGVVRLRAGVSVPPWARVLVIRETYVAGFLVDSRPVFLRGLPATVEAPGLGTVESTARLLDCPLALRWAEAGQGGSGRERGVEVSLEGVDVPPGGPWTATLAPGWEWRVLAVDEGQGPVGLTSGDPTAEERLREAVRQGRPVSLLCVTLHGMWPTDSIEPDSREPGRDGGG